VNVEQTLTDELASVAGSIGVPPPPAAAALVQEAETARSRRRLRVAATTLLAAAAVVAAIVAGNEIGRPDAAPSPAPQPTADSTARPARLPTGAPPAIAFVKNDRLYVDDRVQPGSWVSVLNRGATAVGYVDDGNDLTQTIVLFRDGSEITRAVSAASQIVVLSPDGTKAAWVERDGSSWYLAAYDVANRRELGRLPVDAHVLGHVGRETEAWETLRSVDDQGVVTWGGVVRGHVWTPGSAPRDTAPEAPRPTPSAAYPVRSDIVTVSPDGAWGAWTVDHTGEQPQGGSDIPDQYDVEVTAQRPGQPASAIHFRLPRNTNASGTDWESNGAFLVTVFEDPTGVSWHYVRCVIATRKCEVAPTPADP
jgi:hypothetical protein